ncbi:unnamed protein product [Zymoseptoria tritici ST99CH_3D7]|uniref:Thioredoxin domain-containing protein n=2 Tax=Zymoseptoria tritici TaxID=1047171 RepID=A0A1X7RJ29_ZYMT9|nr:unnamed protein product [Zymoseptoria tritici ST99CH_3D7]SMR45956.1 unnamed protein product [Zymoseptoria tritici ST99CH_1E4]
MPPAKSLVSFNDSGMRIPVLQFGTRSHLVLARGTRPFSTTCPAQKPKNRVYPSRIRNEDELQTLLLTSASTRVPLITLWMTTWNRDCDAVSPIIKELIEDDGVGEEQGSVSFVEVEMDSPDLGGPAGIAQRYMINKVPTLLAFDRQEPQLETKVTKLEDMKSKEFVTKWIATEAARRGEGGAGGGGGLNQTPTALRCKL